MNNIYIYLEYLKKNYINFFIIFFIWSSLFISLNTNFASIFVLFDEFNYTNVLKARSFFVLISVFIIIFFIFKNKMKLKNNFFYFLLLSILVIQSIYFFSDDFDLIKNFTLTNIYENNLFLDRKYGIQLQAIQLFISIFISLFLMIIFNEKKNEIAFIFTFLIFLIIFFVFYFSLYIVSLPSHLNSNDILLYFNSFYAHGAQIIDGEPSIRITGLGRSLLIISVILFCLYLLFKKKFSIRFLLIIFLLFINTSIILTGSRFASYSLFFSYIFVIIFLDIVFLKKIKYFIIFLILPIILFLATGSILKDLQLNKQLESLNLDNLDLNNLKKETIEYKELKKILEEKKLNKGIGILNNSRYVENLSNTTGRVQIWKNAIKISEERGNYLFGNGINADRRLLTKYGNKFGTNASNGLINIYLTSGTIGLIFFILANLIILRKVYHFIFVQKCFSDFKKFYLINFSIITIFIFYQRIFFENSITSFGVDYLIFIVCCYFLLNNIKNLQIIKI